MRSWPASFLSLLRLISALLFLEHGTAKLFAFPPGAGAHPTLNTLAGAAALLELIGGALLTVGLFTRVTAFLLSGEMAVAYFLAHYPVLNPHHGALIFYPILNHGELAVLYCFIFLYLTAAGGGSWSLDALVRRRP